VDGQHVARSWKNIDLSGLVVRWNYDLEPFPRGWA
jgi:hypothetical protein